MQKLFMTGSSRYTTFYSRHSILLLLSVRHHAADFFNIRLIDGYHTAQMTFVLCRAFFVRI